MPLEFQQLEGWTAVSDAASILSVSRQAVHKMLNSGIFSSEDVRKIGSGLKPVYIIRTTVVQELFQA